jgi:hypothetical protein
MNANSLILISASIVGLLGSAHLLLTFFGPKLRPRDPALQMQMQQVHPVITRQTTMWRAWLGFNASHSLGAMLFGLLYGRLALVHPALLFDDVWLLGGGLAFLLSYLILAIRYWFITPLIGVSLALLGYLAGAGLALA